MQAIRIFPLIVPLMLTGLRRAETIALAMDLKAFNASPRRSYFVDLYRGRIDVVIRVVAVLLFVLAIAARIGGLL